MYSSSVSVSRPRRAMPAMAAGGRKTARTRGEKSRSNTSAAASTPLQTLAGAVWEESSEAAPPNLAHSPNERKNDASSAAVDGGGACRAGGRFTEAPKAEAGEDEVSSAKAIRTSALTLANSCWLTAARTKADSCGDGPSSSSLSTFLSLSLRIDAPLPLGKEIDRRTLSLLVFE